MKGKERKISRFPRTLRLLCPHVLNRNFRSPNGGGEGKGPGGEFFPLLEAGGVGPLGYVRWWDLPYSEWAHFRSWKSVVLPFSADLEDRKKEIFCRIFMWDNARPPACPSTRRALLPKSGQSLGYLSIALCGRTLRPTGQCLALYHLVRAGPSPSQYALVYGRLHLHKWV